MLVRRLPALALALLLPLLFAPVALAQTGDQGDAGAGCAGCGCAGAGIAIMIGVPLLAAVIGIAVNGFIAYWINKDAKSRGMENATMWAVLGFFLGLLGLLIYILSRPQPGGPPAA
jgi:hypothetical protein